MPKATKPPSTDTGIVAGARPPRIYTIHPALPFLPTLARALLDGELSGAPTAKSAQKSPLDVARTTLLLPTRRATRALQDAFLAAGSVRARLLPRVRPIAEADEDLTLLAGLTGPEPAGDASLAIAPSIPELDRRLVLTRLVLQWSRAMRRSHPGDTDADLAPFAAAGADTPAQAANLARELARLVDMVETENVSLDQLKTLVADEFATHWQQTLAFLEIVTSWWPAHLAEAGYLSPMDRRNQLILAEADRLHRMPPATPVIVAGVTGSIPATVELMRAIGGLPKGAIVLPGVDLDLDEASWQAITADGGHAEHPQFGLKTLLDRLGVSRADIRPLGPVPEHGRATRTRLVSEAMRPSATTGAWATFAATADRSAYAAAAQSMTLIEAPSAPDEAETIALILREAAETPGRTAALISPDRLLARRVAVRLEQWGIRVDDSAGRPFGKTVPGTVLDLVIDCVAVDFAPGAAIALLKHPLVRLGLDPFAIRRAARAIELAAFRSPYLGRGIGGIIDALDKAERDCLAGATPGGEPRGLRRPKAVRRLFPDDWRAAHDLIARLATAMAPLTDAFAAHAPHPLSTLAAAHAAAAEALCALPDSERPFGAPADAPASPLWQGEAGLTASTLFEALMRDGLTAPAVVARDYPDLYRALVATENVRPRVAVHPRLSIWGPFEARLQQPDVVILGSLNDGTWPESADPGPWLNRPMRASLGLPAPEEKIGYAAHDFTQALGAPRVFLTRAGKIDGVPTVPSRWLMRLQAVLTSLDLKDALASGAGTATYLAWALSRDQAERRPIEKPKPTPPLAMRPRKLSVSAVETWISNPYAIFASHILGLEALPPLGTEPDAAIRGSIIHEALARFTKDYPSELPDDIEAALLAHADLVLAEWTRHPRVIGFWRPRFERFARWFAETERARRTPQGRVVAEIKGTTEIGPAAMPFILTARADRLDISGGSVIITDYKTGTPPSAKKVLAQSSPQLPLEAAIALAGGFEGMAPLQVAGLRYIQASGGEPPGVQSLVVASAVAELAAKTIDGLNRHIAKFDDPATPYAVVRREGFNYDYDEFAHLARVAEWGAQSAPDEDAA